MAEAPAYEKNPQLNKIDRRRLNNDEKKTLIRQVENIIQGGKISLEEAIKQVAERERISKTRLNKYFSKQREQISEACENGYGNSYVLPLQNQANGKTETIPKVNFATVQDSEPDWPSISHQYAESDRYLSAVIGMFYKTKIGEQGQFLGMKCEDAAHAGDRFTAMAIVDQTGSDLRPLTVVGKRVLQCVNPPVNYYRNDDSWMTSEIFEKELEKWNESLQREKRKIALFVERTPVYPRMRSNLTNIKIIPYENNKNAPLDIVRCMKAYYRKFILKHYERSPYSEFDRVEAVYEMRQAWKSITPVEVKPSFIEAGVINDENRDGAYPSVVENLSNQLEKDYELLKNYIEFDDQLVTTAQPITEMEDFGLEEGELGVSYEEANAGIHLLLKFCRHRGDINNKWREALMDLQLFLRGKLDNEAKALDGRSQASGNERGTGNSGNTIEQGRQYTGISNEQGSGNPQNSNVRSPGITGINNEQNPGSGSAQRGNDRHGVLESTQQPYILTSAAFYSIFGKSSFNINSSRREPNNARDNPLNSSGTTFGERRSAVEAQNSSPLSGLYRNDDQNWANMFYRASRHRSGFPAEPGQHRARSTSRHCRCFRAEPGQHRARSASRRRSRSPAEPGQQRARSTSPRCHRYPADHGQYQRFASSHSSNARHYRERSSSHRRNRQDRPGRPHPYSRPSADSLSETEYYFRNQSRDRSRSPMRLSQRPASRDPREPYYEQISEEKSVKLINRRRVYTRDSRMF